ncbi:MAG TPA: DUF6379 domain-containing protein [Patescibacteria group bacterium]|nr:DUF6379 domain-containing protein [Patescibacteria group bacterium]
MFDKYMVPTRGFQNVRENGDIVGFQMLLRITYYRGIHLSLIGSLDVTVDGEHFKPEQLRFSLGDRTYTMDELGKEENVHWPFGQPAKLIVLKPGGLQPGIHDVQVEQRIVPAYMPQGMGFPGNMRRKITLVA